jgi:hypothetical protein
MARKSNIPFGDKRRQELNRINRNIENKQKNLEKRFGMRADFEKKSAADFTSIKEYNQYIEQAKHFTKRAANKFDLVNPQTGTSLSFNVLRKVEKEMKRINRIKDKEFAKIKDLPHKEMGRKTGLTIFEAVSKKIGFSDPKFENFKHVQFDPTHYHGNKDAQMQLHKLKEQYKGDFIRDREEQHFLNYIASLHTAFNESPHPLTLKLSDEIWALHDKIVEMGMDEFTRMYYAGELPTIKFIYGRDEKDIKLAELRQAFFGDDE